MKLLKVCYKALKTTKYKFPKDTLNIMQKCFDGFKNYRRSANGGEDSSDISFA